MRVAKICSGRMLKTRFHIYICMLILQFYLLKIRLYYFDGKQLIKQTKFFFFQTINEVKAWPYDFPASVDFPSSDQRGTVSGRLLVLDRYISLSLSLSLNVDYWVYYCTLLSVPDNYKFMINSKFLDMFSPQYLFRPLHR